MCTVERACILSMQGRVEDLSDAPDSVFTALCESGFTALHYACAFRRVECAMYILHRVGGEAAHVRASNDARSTPFLICAHNNGLSMLTPAALCSRHSSLYSAEELDAARRAMSKEQESMLWAWWAPRREVWKAVLSALGGACAPEDWSAAAAAGFALERNEAGVSALWCACAMGRRAFASALLGSLAGADLERALTEIDPVLGASALFMMLDNRMSDLAASSMMSMPSEALRAHMSVKTKSGFTIMDAAAKCSKCVQEALVSVAGPAPGVTVR
jgi:ankyrin repeat protein